MSRRLPALLCAGALLAAAVWWWLPGEERRIRARLAELAAAASMPAAESELTRLAAAARIGRYFTDDVLLDPGAPYPPMHGREAAIALAARARGLGREMEVELLDVQVAIASATEASASLTAKISMPADGAVDARELDVTLRKQEDGWLISGVRAVATLER